MSARRKSAGTRKPPGSRRPSIRNKSKPFLIGIGGAHSSVGKTSLACALIKSLKHHHPCLVKCMPHIGAIKFTKTDLYASVIEDEETLKQGDKDTSRLLEAGAEKVIWIKSPRDGLDTPLSIALSKLADLDCVIIEGNSAIEFALPDIVIFIFGESTENTKPSAPAIIRQADIVVAPAAYSLTGTPIKGEAKHLALEHYPYEFDDGVAQDIMSFMETIEKNKEIEHLLRAMAVDDRVTCTQARKIAEDLGVPYARVGAAANGLKIKIKSCELGCF